MIRWRGSRVDPSDETLMERYADGDDEAFEEIFRRYESSAHAFFVRGTGCPERARDLYQELFLRVHRARDLYDSSRRFKPWFFKIANNLLIDDRRLAFRSHEVVFEERTVAEPQGVQDRVAAREQLASILGRLSPAERHVLVASMVHGIGYPQLARELGKSVSAVKKMASRAMLRVRASPHLKMVTSDLRAR